MAELVVGVMFGLVLVIFLGTYWFLFEAHQKSAKDSLRRRLEVTDAAKTTRQVSLKTTRDIGRRPGGALLTRPLGSLRTLVEQSGLKLTLTGLLVGMVGMAVLAFVLVAGFTGLPWLGAGASVVGTSIPYLAVRIARTKRIQKFEELFPEAIDLVGRAMRAGHTFITGLSMVADELPDPVAREFRLIYDQQNYGMDLSEALKNFAVRVPLLDARFFVTAVLTQRQAGGNLAEVLDNLARVIRDRFKVKRQIRVVSAHGRLTGWILGGLPPALALALAIQAPANFTVMFNDPLGIRMIVVAVVLQIVGMLIIRKLVNIEY